MRVLLLDGYDPSDDDRRLVVEAIEALEAGRHEMDLLAVHDFNAVMSAAERTAYHSDEPVISDDVRDSAERLRAADALLFCYPTVTFNVPRNPEGLAGARDGARRGVRVRRQASGEARHAEHPPDRCDHHQSPQ